MTTVAVTGAAGFLGRHLLRALAASMPDAALVGIARRAPSDPQPGVTYRTAMVGADLVFHLAGSAGVGFALDHPKADLCANAGSLLDVIAACAPGTRIVLASSVAVYGDRTGAIDETAAPAPATPYAISKAAAESYLAYYAGARGLDGRIARIANAYGPGLTRLAVYELGRQALAHGAPLRVRGNPAASRDFIHAADVAAALVLIGRRGAAGATYNVATGEPASVRALARRIAAEAGLPPEAVHADGAPEAGKVEASHPGIGRLRALGFAPAHTLDSGIRDTMAWIRSNT